MLKKVNRKKCVTSFAVVREMMINKTNSKRRFYMKHKDVIKNIYETAIKEAFYSSNQSVMNLARNFFEND
jgi:hypothetical protein